MQVWRGETLQAINDTMDRKPEHVPKIEWLAIPRGADDIIEDGHQTAQGLFIGEISDVRGSVNFEVTYDEAGPTQNEDHEQAFVVIADGDNKS